MAAQLGPIVFVVIVIGGLGSLGGALIASLFIGIVNNLAISLDLKLAVLLRWLGFNTDEAEGLWRDVVNMSSANMSAVLPYLLLVLILIFRPRGLFGTRDV